jgi:hypothetical protein
MNIGNLKLLTILQIVGLDFIICLVYLLTTENNGLPIYITAILRPIIVFLIIVVISLLLSFLLLKNSSEFKTLLISFPFFIVISIIVFNFMRNNFKSIFGNFFTTLKDILTNQALLLYFTLPLVLSFIIVIGFKIKSRYF